MRKFLILSVSVLLFCLSVTPVMAEPIDCKEHSKYLSVDEASDCKDEFSEQTDISDCETFYTGRTNDDLREACIVIKDYEIPTLPRPTGVPTIDAEDFSDVRDVRGFFIDEFFPRVTRLLIWGIGLVGFFMVLYAGVRYFTTFGKEERAEDAKQAMIYALVGVLVAFLSFAIIQIIGSLPF